MAHTVTNLNTSGSMYIKRNRVKFKNLPEPGEEFLVDDVEPTAHELRQLNDCGAVEVVTQIYGSDTSGSPKNVYSTTEDGYDAIQSWLATDEEREGFLPCGHSGFTNLGDSLECKRCGNIHPKSEVQ